MVYNFINSIRCKRRAARRMPDFFWGSVAVNLDMQMRETVILTLKASLSRYAETGDCRVVFAVLSKSHVSSGRRVWDIGEHTTGMRNTILGQWILEQKYGFAITIICVTCLNVLHARNDIRNRIKASWKRWKTCATVYSRQCKHSRTRHGKISRHCGISQSIRDGTQGMR